MWGWCESVVVSFPSSLVVFFLGFPSLHALVFIQKTFLWLVLLFLVCVVLYCYRNGKREGRCRGGQGEDAWSIKFDNVHIQIKDHHKASIKSKHHIFKKSIRGLSSPSKASSLIKPKSKAHGFYEVLNSPLNSCGLLLGSLKISP